MRRYIGMKGFDHMGRGMPELQTARTKKMVEAFDKRLERILRASADYKSNRAR